MGAPPRLSFPPAGNAVFRILPPMMFTTLFTDLPLGPWGLTILSATLAAFLAWVGVKLGAVIVRRATAHSRPATLVAEAAHRPVGFALPLLALQVVLRNAPDDLARIGAVRQALTIVLIAAITWLLMRLVRATGEAIVMSQPMNVADNLVARRINTQTRFVARLVTSVVALVGFALALMTIPDVRQIGASLLASAGLAGIAAGFAARPLLGNLIAGLQIAFTQPIRLDDVVIVEGEWGRIEEITSTYVVVNIWDERRLVVPLQWWIEHPFQNWTRTSASLLGTVFLWVDYRMPLQPLRELLQRVCENSSLWDGRVCLIQVTDFSERAMQLRCLVSTADSGKGWDLRCLVREEMMVLMQRDYPAYLPRIRNEVESLRREDPRSGTPEDTHRPPVPEQRSPTPENQPVGVVLDAGGPGVER
jgi:small-conductance mechanosensitive channel